MHGYDKNDLLDEKKTEMSVKKGKSWKNKVLTKAKHLFK